MMRLSYGFCKRRLARAQRAPHVSLLSISMSKVVDSRVQDLKVVARLRQQGVPLQRILTSKIHGRGGLLQEAEPQSQKRQARRARSAKPAWQAQTSRIEVRGDSAHKEGGGDDAFSDTASVSSAVSAPPLQTGPLCTPRDGTFASEASDASTTGPNWDSPQRSVTAKSRCLRVQAPGAAARPGLARSQSASLAEGLKAGLASTSSGRSARGAVVHAGDNMRSFALFDIDEDGCSSD